MKKELVVKQLKNVLLVTLGAFLLAFAVNTCFAPYSIVNGGVSGVGIIFESILGIDKGVIALILNILFLGLALIFISKSFFLKSIYGSILFPVLLIIIPTRPLVNDQLVISMVVGSVIAGLGVRVTYLGEGSTGGTNIPPVIFQKYFKFPIAKGIMLSDGVIVIMSLFILGVEKFILAFIAVLSISKMYEYFETGLNRSKAVYIISDDHEALREAIYQKLNRGITLVHATKSYRNTETKMLLVIVKTSQLQKLRILVDAVDEEAFMFINTVSDVHGKGFSYIG